MYQKERILQILQELKVRTTLSNQDIMAMFDISRDTARRDIVKLVEEGVVMRTHGGITLPTLMSELRSYHNRTARNLETKRLLARHVAAHLPDNGLVFLDVSTTVEEVCEFIPDAVSVYTCSIYNAERLMEKSCEVNMLGGRLNRRYRFFGGGAALSQLEGMRLNVAVLGAAAVQDDGFYFSESEDADIKRKVVERANSVIIVADDSKFCAPGRFRGASFADVDILVTNSVPPERLLHGIRKAGVTLDICG